MKHTIADHAAPATRAGLAASIAYLAMMVLDMRLLHYPQNDLVLQGRMAPVPRRLWLPAGLVMHCSFGILLALVYGLLARDHLPGPPWLRGVLLASGENLLIWPLTLLIDRFHPAVRDGQMPPMNTWRCFTQAVLRHIAFGAVLGATYPAAHSVSELKPGAIDLFAEADIDQSIITG